MRNSIEIERAYENLGLDLGASKADAKRAYYKLAKVYHPDKNPRENASEIFRTIQEAYKCIQEATDEDITRCRSEVLERLLYQAELRPIEMGTYNLLNLECLFNHRPPIVCQRRNFSGWMIMSEAQRIIHIAGILDSSIKLSGTFNLQDPGVMLIEENTSRNGRLSNVISDGYYKWDGQYLTIHVDRRSAPTGPYPGVRYVLKSVWSKRW